MSGAAKQAGGVLNVLVGTNSQLVRERLVAMLAVTNTPFKVES
jgi:hypothetical protein